MNATQLEQRRRDLEGVTSFGNVVVEDRETGVMIYTGNRWADSAGDFVFLNNEILPIVQSLVTRKWLPTVDGTPERAAACPFF